MLKLATYDVVFQEFPDEVTLALNLSLCPNACPGCHSSYLAGNVGETLTPALLDELMEKYAGAVTCIGFMGGDNDPLAVQALACRVRGRGLKAGWYSGRDTLPPLPGFNPGTFSYIKLGPYVEALGPLSSPTTNQRLYEVTAEGGMKDRTAWFRERRA